mmetsp:Transcript_158052/g.506987  ORF Transcript_158052/g.506987 Transcript_158052/m.506987 type:complete len:203 (+) Transcript_158052:285-893(+)
MLHCTSVALDGCEDEFPIILQGQAREAQSMAMFLHNIQHYISIVSRCLRCMLQGHGIAECGDSDDLRVTTELLRSMAKHVALHRHSRHDDLTIRSQHRIGKCERRSVLPNRHEHHALVRAEVVRCMLQSSPSLGDGDEDDVPVRTELSAGKLQGVTMSAEHRHDDVCIVADVLGCRAEQVLGEGRVADFLKPTRLLRVPPHV